MHLVLNFLAGKKNKPLIQDQELAEKLAPQGGIEPLALRLGGECSIR